MTILLAVNAAQGRHYRRRMFGPRSNVRVAIDPHGIRGRRDFRAIMVGQFTGCVRNPREHETYMACRAAGVIPERGPNT